MSLVNKVDSNATSAHYAEEAGIAVLPSGTVKWYPMEPNEYSDFGGQVTTVARNPINASRQRKKGFATDLGASGGLQTDLTQTNIERLLRGFFFADFREKPDTKAYSAEATYNSDGSSKASNSQITISGVTAATPAYDTSDDFTATPGGFLANDIVFASGFSNSANNGMKTLSAVSSSALTTNESLVDENSPPAEARVIMVGHQFAGDDLEVDASSGFAKLVTTSKDLTELGLVPGEWIYIGGDSASTKFPTNAANNGFKRVRSIAQNEIVIDKSDQDMATESTSGGETIQVFCGRVIKNESDPTNIKRRSYQIERTLGYNDDAQPTKGQAEYLEGAFPNELTVNIGTADKITVDLSFVSTNNSTLDENDGSTIKSDAGSKVTLIESDGFNTSSDVTRQALSRLSDGDESPEELFAFLQEVTLSVNNNISPNKAIGTFGAFDVTAGTFAVQAEATAYFADVAAIQAVRNTDDVSFDFHLAKKNAGVSFDLPLVTLGDGRPNVAQDEPVTIPLTNEAATGAKIHTNLDHTLLMVFFDYLPDAAE